MRMIDLSEISGLPIKYDEERGRIHYDMDVICDKEVAIPLAQLTPVLLNKYLKYPEIVYKYHRNIYYKSNSPKDLAYDIVYLPFGLLGIEFVKTHVYHSEYVEGKYDSLVEVLSGNLTVLIQRNRPKEDPYDFETYVDEVTIITLRKGEKLAIPTGVYYTFVNTGVAPVIFGKLACQSQKAIDYTALKREKGLAYFLISKNAKVEVVANPKYKIACKLKIFSFKRLQNDAEAVKRYIYQDSYSKKKTLYNLLAEELIYSAIYAY